MRVIWLASYPKSGNTFARMLLHDYLFGPAETSAMVGRRIPDIHIVLSQKSRLPSKGGKAGIVKTHFCFSGKHPYAKETAGFIYILRNPRDVLLSNARYLGAASDGPLKEFSRTFIGNMGVPRWRQMGFGSWPEHLASWLAATPRMPHIFVRYEDLRSDAPNVLKRMVRFLGLQPDDSKIRMAVENCAIDRARETETEDRKQGRASLFFGSKGGEPFVGEGKMGQSLADIGEDIEKAYRAKFGNFVDLFGYG